jgi:hypothetical protein
LTPPRARPAEWNQLDLLDSDLGSAWALLLKLVVAVVDQRGLKQVAFDLDVSKSYLSHCLNEREHHNVPAKWIPYFVVHAANDDIPALIALLRDLKVEPRARMKPEEEVARYKRVLASYPEAVRKHIAAEVYGDDETSRFKKR